MGVSGYIQYMYLDTPTLNYILHSSTGGLIERKWVCLGIYSAGLG